MNGKKIVGWLSCDGIAAVGCSSMGAGSIGGKNYCGNLLWQSSLTLLPQKWYNMQYINMSGKLPMGIAAKVPQVKYSAAHSKGRERIESTTVSLLPCHRGLSF